MVKLQEQSLLELDLQNSPWDWILFFFQGVMVKPQPAIKNHAAIRSSPLLIGWGGELEKKKVKL